MNNINIINTDRLYHDDNHNNIYNVYKNLYKANVIDNCQFIEYISTLDKLEYYKTKMGEELVNAIKLKNNLLFQNDDISREFLEQ